MLVRFVLVFHINSVVSTNTLLVLTYCNYRAWSYPLFCDSVIHVCFNLASKTSLDIIGEILLKPLAARTILNIKKWSFI